MPNPYAAVRRGGIELHFFGVAGFEPANSMGSVVLLVPDTGELHAAFAAGLRAAFGKVPASGHTPDDPATSPAGHRRRFHRGTIGGYIRWRNQHARPKTAYATGSKIRHPDYPFKAA